MNASPALTTTLSSKGQVVIPKALREQLQLQAGQLLEIKEQAGALVLRARDAGRFPASTLDDLIGCVNYSGPARSLEEMDEAVSAMFADDS